jgi:hypothetical protein
VGTILLDAARVVGLRLVSLSVVYSVPQSGWDCGTL